MTHTTYELKLSGAWECEPLTDGPFPSPGESMICVTRSDPEQKRLGSEPEASMAIVSLVIFGIAAVALAKALR